MVSHEVVVAGVASATHLVHCVAWVRELLRREPGEVTVRLMGSRTFFGGKPITTEDVEGLMPDGVTVLSWDGRLTPKGVKLWMLSVGAVGIKPWLRVRKANPLRRFPVIVTDEGLGTYGNWMSRYQAYKRQGGKDPKTAIRTTAVESATRLLGTSRWALHVESDGGWALNKTIADEFRRLAPEPRVNGRVVLLSQPWPELGVMSEAEHLAHVSDLAIAVADAGRELVVLPHPGEPEGRYKTALSGAVMAEQDPDVLGACCVVGASSTAMLNVAAIFGVPAARVGTAQLDVLDRQLAPRQASLLSYHAGRTMTPHEFGRRLAEGFGR